jgi:uncharacterized protein (DUF4415 family)
MALEAIFALALPYAYNVYILHSMPLQYDPAKAATSEKPMRAEYDFSKGKRGAVIAQKGKTRISIFIDNAVLAEFRARAEKSGTGYQTMMNEALRTYLAQAGQPVTEQVLRNVLREEMPEYLAGLGARPGGRSTVKASRAGRGSAKQSGQKK